MMGTPLVNGCLACVYFAGQSLTLTRVAQQVAHTICEKWWIVAEEVKNYHYEEVPRSRPAVRNTEVRRQGLTPDGVTGTPGRRAPGQSHRDSGSSFTILRGEI